MNSNKNNSTQLSKTKKLQTILFVDPDPSAYEIVNMLLHGSKEYIVINSYDAEEAIKKARDYIGNIDLILLTLSPPHLWACELYKELQREDFLQVPVIFQTGMPRIPEEIKELIKAGRAEVIYMPYDRAEFFATITRLQLK
jgi:response regulator RpfG family c-di-GMP phosphodiesterase